MKLIYIANKNVSVYNSQVVSLLNNFVQNYKISEIVLIIGVQNKSERKLLTHIDERIKIKYYQHYPQYPVIQNKTIASISRALSSMNNINEYVIHVRNDILAFYVYKSLLSIGAKTNKLIVDIRGAGLEQFMEYSNKNIFIKKLKISQREKVFKTLKKIQHISVVSESLKSYVINKVGETNSKIHVNSCIANTNFYFSKTRKEKIRDILNINNDETLIVLSTGGNNAWQNTENSINILSKLNCKILNLSKVEVNKPNVINIFVPYEEMPKYLCAADLALIWREKSITNKVASPVKFSEYIACGLPVITNNSIDLVSDFLLKNNTGLIIDSIDSINDQLIQNLKKMSRIEISKIGKDVFGINTIANQYLRLYKQVIKS